MKIKIYLASGWFTPKTREILDKVESILSNHPNVDLYSPRRDGVLLTENQKHDADVLKRIFNENLEHIKDADYVFANIESTDFWNDPGTVYEIGYAMSQRIPVIGFCESFDNIEKRFISILPRFQIYLFLDEISDYISDVLLSGREKLRVMYIGNDDHSIDNKIIPLLESYDIDYTILEPKYADLYKNLEFIFAPRGIDFIISVVDDRKTVVSWSMGVAYDQGIPMITYSDQNYGLNVMLLASIRAHVRGLDELREVLDKINSQGLDSLPEFDISQIESC